MAYATGDLTAAREFHENARVLSEELQNADELATSLDNLGIVAATTGDNHEAVDHFSASLEQRRRDEDQRGTAIALEHLAYALTSLGDLDRARKRPQKASHSNGNSATSKRSVKDYSNLESSRCSLATMPPPSSPIVMPSVSLKRSRTRTSRANGTLNLASATEMSGDPTLPGDLDLSSTAPIRRTRGWLRFCLHDLYARPCRTQSPGILKPRCRSWSMRCRRLDMIGARDSVALCLETLAGALLDLGNPGKAPCSLGAADAIRTETGAAVPGTRTAELDRDRQKTLEALGQDDFDLRYETGADADPIDWSPDSDSRQPNSSLIAFPRRRSTCRTCPEPLCRTGLPSHESSGFLSRITALPVRHWRALASASIRLR